MRVTTDLWVSALMRRVFGAGGFSVVIKRGATEAGAVFVFARDRIGDVELFGPAPQTSYDSAKPDDRFFCPVGIGEDGEALDNRIEKEKRFDPDIWVVEIEVGSISINDLISIKR